MGGSHPDLSTALAFYLSSGQFVILFRRGVRRLPSEIEKFWVFIEKQPIFAIWGSGLLWPQPIPGPAATPQISGPTAASPFSFERGKLFLKVSNSPSLLEPSHKSVTPKNRLLKTVDFVISIFDFFGLFRGDFRFSRIGPGH